MAAYETPVSDRMWHLTATAATPAPVLQTLLHHLAEGDGWDTAVGAPVDEKSVTAATKPLTEAGWKHTVNGRWIRWTSPAQEAGVQFDAFAAQKPNSTLATWTIWAGPSLNHPTWTLTASPHTPSSLLADLAENVAHGTGTARPTPLRTSAARASAPRRQPSRQRPGIQLGRFVWISVRTRGRCPRCGVRPELPQTAAPATRGCRSAGPADFADLDRPRRVTCTGSSFSAPMPSAVSPTLAPIEQ
ncbi:DUF317 domain-containing protein [Streptomyces sp. NPDC050636]|uniref:DUF317 domain-containing protein n=1 Tax=Streptomyces sp. NPDC050636 TaxID=3154510 RepID=UPI00343FCDF8